MIATLRGAITIQHPFCRPQRRRDAEREHKQENNSKYEFELPLASASLRDNKYNWAGRTQRMQELRLCYDTVALRENSFLFSEGGNRYEQMDDVDGGGCEAMLRWLGYC